MAATVAKMTKHELREIIESTVEQKLLELLRDPDQGLILKKLSRIGCFASERLWPQANGETW